MGIWTGRPIRFVNRGRRGRVPAAKPSDLSRRETPRPAEVKLELEAWKGPLPHPASLQAFEDIAPGTALKIINEFQAEAAHRRKLEKHQAFWMMAEGYIGQFSAIVFALTALGVATYAIYMGAEWAGAIIGGTMITGCIFALRSRSKK